MTALWISLGILLGLLFLMICPVAVTADFREKLEIKVRYLCFTYQVAPQKKKPKKAKQKQPESKNKEPQEHKKSKFQEILEQKGVSGLLELLRQVGEVAVGVARKLFSHLVVTRLHLEIVVADEDAAQAALHYGYVCGVVCTALSVFLQNSVCKRYHVQITPDFDRKESRAVLEFQARIRLLFLITSSLSAFWHFIQIQKDSGQAAQRAS